MTSHIFFLNYYFSFRLCMKLTLLLDYGNTSKPTLIKCTYFYCKRWFSYGSTECLLHITLRSFPILIAFFNIITIIIRKWKAYKYFMKLRYILT